MSEAAYQSKLIRRLKEEFPGAVVLKNDSGYIQGIPDLLILWKQNWATLEVKVRKTASHQPNQDYWVEYLDDMSFAAFIYPENEREVFRDLREAFGA